MPLTVYLICAVTTWSLTWLIGRDTITQPLRSRIAAAADDGVKAARNGKASRWQQAAAWLDELVLCPWCAGMWCGLAVAAGWAVLTSPDLSAWETVWAVGTSAFVSRMAAGTLTWLVLLGDPNDD